MALVALRCAYAPTKTVSVLFYVLYPSWPVSVWLNVVFVCSAPGPVGHLSFTENPGHVSQSELERPAGEERHPHRYLNHPLSNFSWSSGCLLNHFLSCACRVSHFLGGIQQNKTLVSRITCPTWHRSTGSPDLNALTTYTIQVAGMTSKGQGQLSSSTISSGVPPGEFFSCFSYSRTCMSSFL